MNRTPNAGFEPSSPLLRKAFAVAAVAATFATAHFIDALAHGYGITVPAVVTMVAVAPVNVSPR